MLTLILAIVFLLLAVALLGVKVFFVKGGRFPSGHAHDNPSLRQKGVSCPSKE